jgi:hypothetical protein
MHETRTERAPATSNSELIAHDRPAEVSLDRVRFVAAGTLRDFNELDRLARQFLGSNPPAPPSDVPVSFEVTDDEVFVSVNYVQGKGERYWYVKFTRAGEVDSWGAAILK